MEHITASELRKRPAQYKREQLQQWYVQPIYQKVLQASNSTTSYYADIQQTLRDDQTYFGNTRVKHLTSEEKETIINDIVRLLKVYLIDCDIEYKSQWVDVTPTEKREKKGIYIDWS